MLSESAQIFNQAPAQQHTDPIPTTAANPPSVEKAQHIQPAKPQPRAAATRPANSITPTPRSSDVDVLIALMRYIESPDNDLPLPAREALKDRIRACPAANTEAGIDCRQRICADLPGSPSLCPSK